MRAVALAWAVGLGLMTWRTAQEFGQPPVPGRLLGASAVFAALGLLAEAGPGAARVAGLAAWGFDLAVLLQIPPHSLTSLQGFAEGPRKTGRGAPGTAPGTATGG